MESFYKFLAILHFENKFHHRQICCVSCINRKTNTCVCVCDNVLMLASLWLREQIVKKVNLYCLSTFIQADAMKVEFPEMMSEVIASQLPRVLAGMVRPLLFHGK